MVCSNVPAILLLLFISAQACQPKLTKKALTFFYTFWLIWYFFFLPTTPKFVEEQEVEKQHDRAKRFHLAVRSHRQGKQSSAMWCPPAHFSERKECLILTYCRRNVSEGRVIGIYIGRIMGGREHSVVVDSDSWTMTTERKNKHWFPPMWTHDRRHSEGKTTGGMWCAGMRQSDAELSARRRRWLSDAAHHSHVYTWSLLYDDIVDINSIKQVQLIIFKKLWKYFFFGGGGHTRYTGIDFSIFYLMHNWLLNFSSTMSRLRTQQHILGKVMGKTARDHAVDN